MTIRLRSLPTVASPDALPQIDLKAGVIRGVSVIQAVEALGHGMLVDQTTLSQVADSINASDGGIKSRFTHPGMCEDGLGTQLGKVSNAAVVGDKVRADLTLLQSAKSTPKGDLYNYVLNLAKESPADVALSIVFEPNLVWTSKSGTEVPAKRNDAGDWGNRPSDALNDKPTARVKRLTAVDVVGEGAANRDGLFADTSSESAEAAFAELDRFLASSGVSLERAQSLTRRYFHARGLKSTTAGDTSASHKAVPMTPEELKALRAKHPTHSDLLIDAFSSGKTVAETELAIKDAADAAFRADVKSLREKVEADKVAHAAALAAKDVELAALAAKVAAMEPIAALGKRTPPDVGSLEGEVSESDGSDAALEKKWKSDPKLQAQFMKDKDAFLAYAREVGDPVTVGSDGRHGAVGFKSTSKDKFSVVPISHAHVIKKTGDAGEGV